MTFYKAIIICINDNLNRQGKKQQSEILQKFYKGKAGLKKTKYSGVDIKGKVL